MSACESSFDTDQAMAAPYPRSTVTANPLYLLTKAKEQGQLGVSSDDMVQVVTD